jgi:hypothetical protein
MQALKLSVGQRFVESHEKPGLKVDIFLLYMLISSSDKFTKFTDSMNYRFDIPFLNPQVY